MTDRDVYNVLVCGVGGTGVIDFGALLRTAADYEGISVWGSEKRGRAQRGGAVLNMVRYILEHTDGSRNKKGWLTGFIPDGAADLLIATEMSEALRNAKFVSKRTEIIMNTFELRPMGAAYPDKAEVLDFLKQHARHVYPIGASRISMGEFHSYRLTNFILLGVALFQTEFPLKFETFDAILKRDDQKKALRIGFDLVKTSS